MPRKKNVPKRVDEVEEKEGNGVEMEKENVKAGPVVITLDDSPDEKSPRKRHQPDESRPMNLSSEPSTSMEPRAAAGLVTLAPPLPHSLVIMEAKANCMSILEKTVQQIVENRKKGGGPFLSKAEIGRENDVIRRYAEITNDKTPDKKRKRGKPKDSTPAKKSLKRPEPNDGHAVTRDSPVKKSDPQSEKEISERSTNENVPEPREVVIAPPIGMPDPSLPVDQQAASSSQSITPGKVRILPDVDLDMPVKKPNPQPDSEISGRNPNESLPKRRQGVIGHPSSSGQRTSAQKKAIAYWFGSNRLGNLAQNPIITSSPMNRLQIPQQSETVTSSTENSAPKPRETVIAPPIDMPNPPTKKDQKATCSSQSITLGKALKPTQLPFQQYDGPTIRQVLESQRNPNQALVERNCRVVIRKPSTHRPRQVVIVPPIGHSLSNIPQQQYVGQGPSNRNGQNILVRIGNNRQDNSPQSPASFSSPMTDRLQKPQLPKTATRSSEYSAEKNRVKHIVLAKEVKQEVIKVADVPEMIELYTPTPLFPVKQESACQIDWKPPRKSYEGMSLKQVFDAEFDEPDKSPEVSSEGAPTPPVPVKQVDEPTRIPDSTTPQTSRKGMTLKQVMELVQETRNETTSYQPSNASEVIVERPTPTPPVTITQVHLPSPSSNGGQTLCPGLTLEQAMILAERHRKTNSRQSVQSLRDQIRSNRGGMTMKHLTELAEEKRNEANADCNLHSKTSEADENSAPTAPTPSQQAHESAVDFDLFNPNSLVKHLQQSFENVFEPIKSPVIPGNGELTAPIPIDQAHNPASVPGSTNPNPRFLKEPETHQPIGVVWKKRRVIVPEFMRCDHCQDQLELWYDYSSQHSKLWGPAYRCKGCPVMRSIKMKFDEDEKIAAAAWPEGKMTGPVSLTKYFTDVDEVPELLNKEQKRKRSELICRDPENHHLDQNCSLRPGKPEASAPVIPSTESGPVFRFDSIPSAIRQEPVKEIADPAPEPVEQAVEESGTSASMVPSAMDEEPVPQAVEDPRTKEIVNTKAKKIVLGDTSTYSLTRLLQKVMAVSGRAESEEAPLNTEAMDNMTAEEFMESLTTLLLSQYN